MRATLSHFLNKMGLKRPGGPSSQVTQFPSSDSSLPESLRVLKHTHLQLLGKPELSGISKDRNALQSKLKSKLAASEKTDIVRCSSRFLDFDVQ